MNLGAIAILSILLASTCVLAIENWIQALPGICKVRECCHPNDGTGYILYEKGCDNLLDDLEKKVFGQPFLSKYIYKHLMNHLKDDNPPRPLVLSLNGLTGTGKTYVARLIAQNLYREGMRSKFVKYISSSFHFPDKIQGEQEMAKQRQKLRDMVRDTISNCERSLIILDDLDRLPEGVIDVLQPMLDYVDKIDGLRYNKAIFILVSSTGGEALYELAYETYRDGKERNDISSKNIEKILMRESYDRPGGLQRSNLIRRNSISAFVPFLPLDRSHIESCIKAEIEEYPIMPENLNQLIGEIAEELLYFPEGVELYSGSGCKRIHDKVVSHIGPSINLNLDRKDKTKESKHQDL